MTIESAVSGLLLLIWAPELPLASYRQSLKWSFESVYVLTRFTRGVDLRAEALADGIGPAHE